MAENPKSEVMEQYISNFGDMKGEGKREKPIPGIEILDKLLKR